MTIAIIIGLVLILAGFAYFGFIRKNKDEEYEDYIAEDIDKPDVISVPIEVPNEIPVIPSAAPAQFGNDSLGFFPMKPVFYPPYETVPEGQPLKPGQKWPSGMHMPTAEQTRAHLINATINAILGTPWGLPMWDISKNDQVERVKLRLGQLGLKSLNELTGPADVLDLRAHTPVRPLVEHGPVAQGIGITTGIRGQYGAGTLAYLKAKRDEARAKGQKVGIL